MWRTEVLAVRGAALSLPVGICQSWAEAELTVGMNFLLISTLPCHFPSGKSTLRWAGHTLLG